MKLQKETYTSKDAVRSSANLHGRWYGDACGTAFGLEVLGERWALLIVRELMLGPRRFSDLRAELPGISAKVLTERLVGLELAGVLFRRAAPPPTPARLYELSEWGYAAEPLIQEIGRWAAASPLHDPTLPLSPVSFLMSLRTMFDPAKADFAARIGLEIGGEGFVAELAERALPIRRGLPDDAEAVFRAPAAPLLAALFYGKVPPEDLAPQGLVIEGDRALALRFASIFELPPKFAAQ